MKKKCSRCGSLKPLQSFRHQNDRANRSSHCDECRKEYHRRYDRANRDPNERRVRARSYYWNNRNRALQSSRKWRLNNPEKQLAQSRRRNTRKRLNVQSRISEALRARVRDAIKYNRKSASTMTLLGCKIPSFRTYLESLWETGMNWENYGHKGWHIDHIIPCSLFDLSKPEHQRRCFHFSNMQPMWWTENLSKGSKIASNQFRLL
jgi:hypothetical protein